MSIQVCPGLSGYDQNALIGLVVENFSLDSRVIRRYVYLRATKDSRARIAQKETDGHTRHNV
jgi:hypothetical protein